MVSIKKLDESYNQRMLEILSSTPMKTDLIELYFDMSPDLFRSNKFWSNQFSHYGILVDNLLVGFGKHVEFKGLINNKIENVSYFGNFCLHKDFRGKGLFKQLCEYLFDKVLNDSDIGFCAVLNGNMAVEKYFKDNTFRFSRHLSTIHFAELETRSLLITKKKKIVSVYKVIRGNPDNEEQIIDFLKKGFKERALAPKLSKTLFKKKLTPASGLSIQDYLIVYKEEKIVGVCAAWDIKNFKRTKVLKYKNQYKIVYHVFNVICKILRYPKMPKPGHDLKEVYVTDLMIADNEPKVFSTILSVINNEFKNKGYNLIHFSTYKNNPLLKGCKPFYSVPVYSNIYAFSKNIEALNELEKTKNEAKPYLDLALI
ncbi:GNAT family N-acetyltransferase [Flavobacteriaceae bacterium SZ-1-7]|uniref:GNAT family N-acetyltransferase n=1 Tax=Tamlana sedimenti TaxID=3134126 RepID=UPI003129ED34